MSEKLKRKIQEYHSKASELERLINVKASLEEVLDILEYYPSTKITIETGTNKDAIELVINRDYPNKDFMNQALMISFAESLKQINRLIEKAEKDCDCQTENQSEESKFQNNNQE